MRQDPGSNYAITEVLSALSRAAATTTTSSIDHTTGNCASFLVSAGAWATSFVATVQYSDDDSIWTAQTDDGSGNEVSLTLTEASSGTLDVPNPLGRYSRLSIVTGGTCVFSVGAVLGPKRYIAAA